MRDEAAAQAAQDAAAAAEAVPPEARRADVTPSSAPPDDPAATPLLPGSLLTVRVEAVAGGIESSGSPEFTVVLSKSSSSFVIFKVFCSVALIFWQRQDRNPVELVCLSPPRRAAAADRRC